jgi:hypothetical protein
MGRRVLTSDMLMLFKEKNLMQRDAAGGKGDGKDDGVVPKRQWKRQSCGRRLTATTTEKTYKPVAGEVPCQVP